MITFKGDFNHVDGQGRLILSDLVIHAGTPFNALAAAGKPVLFIQAEDVVFSRLVQDANLGWRGAADWDTQEVLEEYPRPALTRAS